MLIVGIYINNRLVDRITARNTGIEEKRNIQYEVRSKDAVSFVWHKPKDGARKLAYKALKELL